WVARRMVTRPSLGDRRSRVNARRDTLPGREQGGAMAIAAAQGLKDRAQAAGRTLSAQPKGLEPYLERSDEPGEWTAREVLSHLLFPPGWDAVALLKSFAERELPVVEIEPGDAFMTRERRTMTLAQFMAALD